MKALSGVVLRTQPDGRLVALAAEGSEAAFEAIVQRYGRPLHAYTRRLLLSDGRGEDVVQQALLSAWAALRDGTEIRDLRAWLYRITHNQAIASLRRPEYDFDQLSESIRGADAPEDDLDRRTFVREALSAVAALPPRQQEVILRTAVEGQSYEQVADALGLSSQAVRGLVYRARGSLRAAMAAVTPSPVVVWAAGRPPASGTTQQWIGVALGGGGSAGAAVAIKSATILATSAALVGGTISGALQLPAGPTAHRPSHSSRPASQSATRSRPSVASRSTYHATRATAAPVRVSLPAASGTPTRASRAASTSIPAPRKRSERSRSTASSPTAAAPRFGSTGTRRADWSAGGGRTPSPSIPSSGAFPRSDFVATGPSPTLTASQPQAWPAPTSFAPAPGGSTAGPTAEPAPSDGFTLAGAPRGEPNSGG